MARRPSTTRQPAPVSVISRSAQGSFMANNPPSVTILAAASYPAGTVLTGTQLFSASDPQGLSDINHITLYDLSTTGGAVWRYNGSIITPGGAAAGGFSFDY